MSNGKVNPYPTQTASLPLAGDGFRAWRWKANMKRFVISCTGSRI